MGETQRGRRFLTCWHHQSARHCCRRRNGRPCSLYCVDFRAIYRVGRQKHQLESLCCWQFNFSACHLGPHVSSCRKSSTFMDETVHLDGDVTEAKGCKVSGDTAARVLLRGMVAFQGLAGCCRWTLWRKDAKSCNQVLSPQPLLLLRDRLVLSRGRSAHVLLHHTVLFFLPAFFSSRKTAYQDSPNLPLPRRNAYWVLQNHPVWWRIIARPFSSRRPCLLCPWSRCQCYITLKLQQSHYFHLAESWPDRLLGISCIVRLKDDPWRSYRILILESRQKHLTELTALVAD